NLNDAGIVQAVYIALLPSAMFLVAEVAEFWVASLPIQFLPVDSFAGKLRSASDEHHAFIIIGCLNAGGISSLGFMSMFVPYWPQLISDGATVVGTLIAMATIIFVAMQLTRFITQASLKPVALLRRSETQRSSVSRLSSTRRPSLMATVSPVAQRLLKQLKPSGWQSVEGRGDPYQPDPVREAHAEEPKRRGSVQWAEVKEEDSARRTSLAANKAKVLPI
ncbi:unnamed protein product, partial [Ectocarpus sp. 6 AP-2014]